MFVIIPAIDLKDGRCVQLERGEADKILISLPDPLSVAMRWVNDGARVLHVIDLDAAMETGSNIGIIKEILEELSPKVEIQVGGGIRSYGRAVELLEEGASRVIFGTVAITNPELIERVSTEFGRDRVMVAIDCRGGKVAVRGWKEVTSLSPLQIARRFEKWCTYMLLTDVDVEGMMRGVDKDWVSSMLSSLRSKVIISGGISSMQDVHMIKELGAYGVVIGSALYTGKLNLREILKII